MKTLQEIKDVIAQNRADEKYIYDGLDSSEIGRYSGFLMFGENDEAFLIPNDRSIVPPFEIDISIPDLNLYIEWNGGYWHSQKEVKRNDEKKKQILGEDLICIEEPSGIKVTKKFVVQQFKKVVKPEIEKRLKKCS
jgi:hypothetical protein